MQSTIGATFSQQILLHMVNPTSIAGAVQREQSPFDGCHNLSRTARTTARFAAFFKSRLRPRCLSFLGRLLG